MTYLPEFIDIEFSNFPVCSCNAGIIGGKDVEFFKKYSHEVFDFVDKNIFVPIPTPSHSLINFNILFEQIVFFNLSRKEGKEVTCLFDRVFEDNGYKYDDVGDFTKIPFLNTFLHFIGSIKRNKKACDMMSRVLLRDHPEYFFEAAALFEKSFDKNYLQNLKTINLKNLELKYSQNQLSKVEASDEEIIFKVPELNIQRSVAEYLKSGSNHSDTSTHSEIPSGMDFILSEASKYEIALLEILKEDSKLSYKYLVARDLNSVKHFNFFCQPLEIQLKRNLQQHALVGIIQTAYNSFISSKNEVRDEHEIEHQVDDSVTIAIVPEILFPYYQEVILEELDYYIFTILENATTLEALLEQLESCFNPDDIKINYENFFQLIMLKLKGLINNKCIRVTDDSFHNGDKNIFL